MVFEVHISFFVVFFSHSHKIERNLDTILYNKLKLPHIYIILVEIKLAMTMPHCNCRIFISLALAVTGLTFVIIVMTSCDFIDGDINGHVLPSNGLFCDSTGAFELSKAIQSLKIELKPASSVMAFLHGSQMSAVLSCILSFVAVILQAIRMCIGFPCGKHLAVILLWCSFITSGLIFLYIGIVPSDSTVWNQIAWGKGPIFTVIAVLAFLGAAIAAHMELKHSKKKWKHGGGGPETGAGKDEEGVVMTV